MNQPSISAQPGKHTMVEQMLSFQLKSTLNLYGFILTDFNSIYFKMGVNGANMQIVYGYLVISIKLFS